MDLPDDRTATGPIGALAKTFSAAIPIFTRSLSLKKYNLTRPHMTSFHTDRHSLDHTEQDLAILSE